MTKIKSARDIHLEAKKVEKSAMAIMLSQSAPAKKNEVAMNLFAQPIKEGQKINVTETQHNFELLQQQLELESHKVTDTKLDCMIKFRNSMTGYLKNHTGSGVFHSHSRQERAKYLDRFIMDKAHEYDIATTPEQKDVVLMRIALESYIHYEAILKISGGKPTEVSKKLQRFLVELLEIKPVHGEDMRNSITNKMAGGQQVFGYYPSMAAENNHWNVNARLNDMVRLTYMETSSSENDLVKANDFGSVFKDFDENKSNDVVRPGQFAQRC